VAKPRFFANTLRQRVSPLAVVTGSLGANIRVSILLPKTSQIILDNVVVLDKEAAGVNAGLPLHREITIRY